jgi:hypothetical protein
LSNKSNEEKENKNFTKKSMKKSFTFKKQNSIINNVNNINIYKINKKNVFYHKNRGKRLIKEEDASPVSPIPYKNGLLPSFKTQQKTQKTESLLDTSNIVENKSLLNESTDYLAHKLLFQFEENRKLHNEKEESFYSFKSTIKEYEDNLDKKDKIIKTLTKRVTQLEKELENAYKQIDKLTSEK